MILWHKRHRITDEVLDNWRNTLLFPIRTLLFQQVNNSRNRCRLHFSYNVTHDSKISSPNTSSIIRDISMDQRNAVPNVGHFLLGFLKRNFVPIWKFCNFLRFLNSLWCEPKSHNFLQKTTIKFNDAGEKLALSSVTHKNTFITVHREMFRSI